MEWVLLVIAFLLSQRASGAGGPVGVPYPAPFVPPPPTPVPVDPAVAADIAAHIPESDIKAFG